MAQASGTVIIEAFACTDTGLVRPANEDFILMGDLDRRALWPGDDVFRHDHGLRGPLLVVCDGIGGAQAGEVASKLAAEAIWAEMCEAQSTPRQTVYARVLRRAVRVANRRVWDASQGSASLRGMGTTLSVAGLAGSALVLAQIGDSRAYVLRNGNLVQVTRDQSVVSALVHAGRLSPKQAQALPDAHMILQALGMRQDLEVSLSIVALCRGDRLLLCSDGLHGPVNHETLTRLLQLRDDPREAAELLVGAARAAGGPDNISAIVASVAGDGVPEPAGPDDLPRFTELDPMEEGARALASTSLVARRLAARAGLVADPGPPVVPATGQHAAIRPRARPGSGAAEPARSPKSRDAGAEAAAEAGQDAAPADAPALHGSRMRLALLAAAGLVVVAALTILLLLLRDLI